VRKIFDTTAVFELLGNKGIKVLAKGNTGVLAHGEKPQQVPIIGTLVDHNKVVKAFASLTRTPGTARLFAQTPLRTSRRLPQR
jgi:hypothetical protein